MLRIAKRPAMSGSASVSTLANCTRPASRRAASSNCGAIARQGPHQVAQKSTSTGRSLRPVKRSQSAAPSATGLPGNSGLAQRPHCGCSSWRAAGIRFTASQCGQTAFSVWGGWVMTGRPRGRVGGRY
jgi:hypothetical protein